MDALSDEEITARMASVPDWSRHGNAIVHVRMLGDFKAAMLYVGAIAYLADAANHHPDIAISWDKVALTLTTHSAGGLTGKDFALASQISALT